MTDKRDMEKQIVEAVCDEALRLGYSISVNDGGDDHALTKSKDRQTILDHSFSTDEVHYHFDGETGQCGWVQFIFGNDGYDVLADDSGNFRVEEICQKAYALSNEFTRGV